MLLKSTLLAFAAVAALGTTVLATSTTPAEAGVHGHRGGHARAISHVRHPRPGIVVRHPGVRHPGIVRYPRRPIWVGHYPRYRPVWYAARPVVYGAAPVITTNRCTCLTKEYTPEGAVLFKDICTNEAAINPPPAPVQTGMLPAPQQQ